jgi:GTPase SAR1 family protein
MYYRGASAAIICYDITSAQSWNMVDSWLQELRRNMTTKLSIFIPFTAIAKTSVVHLVGGKLDLCLANPAVRAVPFETACAYAAENLDDLPGVSVVGEDLSCHEVSAKDDTGVEEVFLAISRKLVEQREEIEDARDALMYGRRQYSSVHPDEASRTKGRGCTC